jgi:hypothetical protein
VLTGIAAAACVAVMFAGSSSPAVVAAAAFALVVVQGRSRLQWLGRSAAGVVARRLARSACYLMPMLAVGLPHQVISWPAVAVAAGVGLVPIVFELRNIRLMFSRTYLDIAPISAIDRFRDTVHFGLSGLAQEYLYRGLVLSALLPVHPVLAIAVSTAAFVGEHLTHVGARVHYDRHDLAVQAWLGLALGTVVAVTGSLPAAMVGHTLYNLPNVLLTLRRPAMRTSTAAPAFASGV